MGFDAPREEFDVTCATCGKATTVPFKPTGARPVLCRDCFSKDRPPRREGGGGFRNERRDREMHDVTCGDCGAETQVPFKPTGDRPVLCRDCFAKNRPPRREGGGGFRDNNRGGDREMHDTSCTRCNAKTQVPFKPTPGREVLCQDCFRR